MEIKKSQKADLDGKKLTFTLIGLVVALFVVWRVFEYRSYDKQTLEKKPADMPIQTAKDLKASINKKNADTLGVKIPDDLMKSAEIIQ